MSDKTANAAQEGGKAVDIAISKMTDIEKAVISAEIVTELGARSKEIGQIIAVVAEEVRGRVGSGCAPSKGCII